MTNSLFPIKSIEDRLESTRGVRDQIEARLGKWLAELGLAQYAEAFEANDIELALLPELTGALRLVLLFVLFLGAVVEVVAAHPAMQPLA